MFLLVHGLWKKKGVSELKLLGMDDKRRITAVFAGSLIGDYLPPQLIYKGTTKRCLSTVQFLSKWHITHSHDHWANEQTMKDYIKKILLPYIKEKRKELKLSADYPALVLYDNFTGQGIQELFDILQSTVVIIPANCIDRLQPLDVSVNKPAKEFSHKQFHAEQQLQQKTDPKFYPLILN